MNRKKLIEELSYLLVAQLRGHAVDLAQRGGPDAPWEFTGRGVSVGEGCTVKLDDVVDLVLRYDREPVVLSANDDEMRKFLAGVVGVVEATREEQHQIWARWASSSPDKRPEDKHRLEWSTEGSQSMLVNAGELAGHPVWLSLYVVSVGRHRLLFYHATSQVTDSRIVDAWLKQTMPKTAFDGDRLNSTDATNFHNVLPRGVK